MDKDKKDLIIFGSAMILSILGAVKFNSIEVLMAGLTGAFAFLGIRGQQQPAVEEPVVAPVDPNAEILD